MKASYNFYSGLSNDSEQIFYIKDNQAYTYAQLWKLVDRTSFYLKSNYIHDEQRVPIYCEDPLNLIIVLFAVISIGACGVLIEKGKKTTEIQDILNQIHSNLIITDNINKIGLENLQIEPVLFDINILPQCMEEIRIEVSNDLDKEACIIYTSGSTGKPKGIIRTRKMVFEHARVLAEVYSFNKNDSVLFLVQLQHAYGLEHILASIYGRATHYIFDEFSYHKVLSFIRENKLTAIVGVPYHYELLSRLNSEIKTNSLRMLLSAGAPLREEVSRLIQKQWGVQVLQEYGSSELATAVVNLNPNKLSAVGKPIENVELRIIDEDDRIVTLGKIGELIIKSPFCTYGYVDDKDLELPIKKQWFYTGDLAYIDEEGDLFITGRKKNIINVAGKKVSPEEVEKVIKNYQGVKEVKVAGEIHSIYGEIINATIVMENGEKLDEIGLLSYCRKLLSDYKLPSIIYYTDKLKLAANGKLQR
ncbi:MAG: class I adenylate-forming enzyme family protein [Anaerocolumna sp.]